MALFTRLYRDAGQQNIKFEIKMLSNLFDLWKGTECGGNCLLMRQIICIIHSMRAGIAQSVQRLYMGWVVQVSNPTGGETIQTGCGAQAASFSGLNLPGRGVDRPPYLSLRLRMIGTAPQLPFCVFMTRYGANLNFFLYFIICLIVKGWLNWELGDWRYIKHI